MTSTEAMLNHHQQLGLFEDHNQDQDQIMSTQMGFFSFPPNNNNLTLPPLASSASHQLPLKTFTILPSSNNLHGTLLVSSSSSSPSPELQQLVSSNLQGPHLLSLERSSPNLWSWEGVDNMKRSGDEYVNNNLGVSAMKMKKIIGRRKVRDPRFYFKTMTDVDVLNDGYKWRKYGQKVVKNTNHPRSYYRCTQDNCRVKKRVERLAEDPRMVITTYEGRHAHSPSHDLEGSQSPSVLTNFFS